MSTVPAGAIRFDHELDYRRGSQPRHGVRSDSPPCLAVAQQWGSAGIPPMAAAAPSRGLIVDRNSEPIVLFL